MKKTHILILVLIAAAVGYMIMSMGSLSTYESIASAKQKQGKFVNVIAKLDKSQPVEYDALKNPNYLSFTAVDSLGNTAKVIYHSPKPPELEHTERVVLKGKMQGDVFECQNILLKCPSKYKDDPKNVQKSLNENTQQ
ncbi:MAG: cytochrome c maturation protein CcmE [Sphingobacteriales bacterium]|nr:cytochrome c maturation protein CcmE [Sphingobacteriales bacterium]MBI3718392.1 cytochrome c maturation protein CcmE [Sphingobacteriales bacterium]